MFLKSLPIITSNHSHRLGPEVCVSTCDDLGLGCLAPDRRHGVGVAGQCVDVGLGPDVPHLQGRGDETYFRFKKVLCVTATPSVSNGVLRSNFTIWESRS